MLGSMSFLAFDCVNGWQKLHYRRLNKFVFSMHMCAWYNIDKYIYICLYIYIYIQMETLCHPLRTSQLAQLTISR